jgi:hypothetical protein
MRKASGKVLSRERFLKTLSIVHFEPETSMAAVRQRQLIFHYRRGAAAAAFKKTKFKKLLNLHKIFILKNATL